MFFFPVSRENNWLNIYLSALLLSSTHPHRNFWSFQQKSAESFWTLLSRVNRRDGEIVLGGEGMEVVRDVKYSLKPFHSHPRDKMQKNLKKNLSEAPEAGVWYCAESGASIIWGSPGQRASQAGNQVAATFMIRSSDSLGWRVQPRFEKNILESVILNSSMTLYHVDFTQCKTNLLAPSGALVVIMVY